MNRQNNSLAQDGVVYSNLLVSNSVERGTRPCEHINSSKDRLESKNKYVWLQTRKSFDLFPLIWDSEAEDKD